MVVLGCGARISTYVIFGPAGSKCCVLNGAAARTCQVGDEVILVASEYSDSSNLLKLKPKIITYKDNNEVDEVLYYDVDQDSKGDMKFEIKKCLSF